MAISFIDEWLIAEGDRSGRWYVVHTQHPRFVLEIIDADDGGYESGECEVIDFTPDAVLIARLARRAGEVFAQWDRKHE